MSSTTAATVKERWGEKLRRARVILDQSQAEAGQAVGIQGQTVGRAEAGRGSLDVFHRLANYYGVTLEAGDGS